MIFDFPGGWRIVKVATKTAKGPVGEFYILICPNGLKLWALEGVEEFFHPTCREDCSANIPDEVFIAYKMLMPS